MVDGSWFLWLMVHMVNGLWFMVYGLWFMVYGVRCVVYGLWFMVLGSGLTASPSLRMRKREPESTPAGTLIISCLLFCSRPRPVG